MRPCGSDSCRDGMRGHLQFFYQPADNAGPRCGSAAAREQTFDRSPFESVATPLVPRCGVVNIARIVISIVRLGSDRRYREILGQAGIGVNLLPTAGNYENLGTAARPTERSASVSSRAARGSSPSASRVRADAWQCRDLARLLYDQECRR